MGVERVEAQRYKCDGCGKVRLSTDIDGPPLGVHGTVTVVDASGAVEIEFFACSKRCITKALESEPAEPAPTLPTPPSAPPEGGAVGVRNPDGSPAAPIEATPPS